MSRPIRSDAEAIVVAMKIIIAQDKLLAAYRTGTTRTPADAIDTLKAQRPRFDAWWKDGER
jgi:hypothetical protein